LAHFKYAYLAREDEGNRAAIVPLGIHLLSRRDAMPTRHIQKITDENVGTLPENRERFDEVVLGHGNSSTISNYNLQVTPARTV
jgi:hypothetical protein